MATDVNIKEQEQPTVTETVIDKQPSGDITITESEVTNTEELNNSEQEANKDVSPDMFAEEEPTEQTETEVPEDYDLSAHGVTDEQKEIIAPVLERFKSVGMTQEQVDVVFDEIMGEPVDYRAQLTAELTPDEKRAYKPMYELLSSIEGNTPEEVLNVMRDVRSVKFLNRLINRLQAPTGFKTPVNNMASGISMDEVKDKFKQFARKANVRPDERNKFIDDLIKQSANKEEASAYLKQFKK
jgi:hypothetical protein